MKPHEHAIGGRPYAEILSDVADLIGGDEDAFPEAAMSAVLQARAAMLERTNPGAHPGYVPTGGETGDSAVYTYEGGEHCRDCTEERFGAIHLSESEDFLLAADGTRLTDCEGNVVHRDWAVGYAENYSDGHDFGDGPYILACGDCERIIAAVAGKHEPVETDVSIVNAWREWGAVLVQMFQDERDERLADEERLGHLTDLIADVRRGLRTIDELYEEVDRR